LFKKEKIERRVKIVWLLKPPKAKESTGFVSCQKREIVALMHKKKTKNYINIP
jgi:hypothetical protein